MNSLLTMQADIASSTAKRRQGVFGQAIRKIGRAVLVAARAFVDFWNVPALGETDPRRSPLLRHNWYV
ncbi:MAG: hypothetical protein IT539_16585 [Bradyrhizobiaceae bacterium]|nr:hypothetical protein [Bradyrhizobiaceae bacterium]